MANALRSLAYSTNLGLRFGLYGTVPKVLNWISEKDNECRK